LTRATDSTTRTRRLAAPPLVAARDPRPDRRVSRDSRPRAGPNRPPPRPRFRAILGIRAWL